MKKWMIRGGKGGFNKGFDILDDHQNLIYQAKEEGILAASKILILSVGDGSQAGMVKTKGMGFRIFDLYEQDRKAGRLTKTLSPFSPKFLLKEKDWTVEGNTTYAHYKILQGQNTLGTIDLDAFSVSMELSLAYEEDLLTGLMVCLILDAVRRHRDNRDSD